MPDKTRAKQVIVEIIRASGGRLQNRSHLFKAFYFAHLFHATKSLTYLSDWPIVRMPYGPGIHDSDQLIGELVEEGTISLRPLPVGPFVATEYCVTSNAIPDLPLPAFDAIKRAVDFVAGKSVDELTEITHRFSRSWNRASEGEELNVYIDLLPEDRFQEMSGRMAEIAAHFPTA